MVCLKPTLRCRRRPLLILTQAAAFSSLPIELKLMIFHKIDDKSTLRGLAHTSISYYQTYAASRNTILNSVASNYLKQKRIHLWIDNYGLTSSNFCWEFATRRKCFHDSAASAILAYCDQAEAQITKPIKLDSKHCLALLEIVDLVIWTERKVPSSIQVCRGPAKPNEPSTEWEKLERRVSYIYPLGANNYTELFPPEFNNQNIKRAITNVHEELQRNPRFKQLACDRRVTRATARCLRITEHEQLP